MITLPAFIANANSVRGWFTVRRDGALVIAENDTRRVILNDPALLAEAREGVTGMLTDLDVIRPDYVADLIQWALVNRGWMINAG